VAEEHENLQKSVCLYLSVSVCESVSVFLSVFVCPLCLYECVCVSVCGSLSVFVRLSLSVCLSVCLSVSVLVIEGQNYAKILHKKAAKNGSIEFPLNIKSHTMNTRNKTTI
jgi:hypothetical protein